VAQAHQPLAAVWLASLLVQGRSDDRLRWHTQSQGHEPAQGDRALARPHEWGRTSEPILTMKLALTAVQTGVSAARWRP
jgi:hypothetical protein